VRRGADCRWRRRSTCWGSPSASRRKSGKSSPAGRWGSPRAVWARRPPARSAGSHDVVVGHLLVERRVDRERPTEPMTACSRRAWPWRPGWAPMFAAGPGLFSTTTVWPPGLAEFVGHDARDEVRRAPGREAHDDRGSASRASRSARARCLRPRGQAWRPGLSLEVSHSSPPVRSVSIGCFGLRSHLSWALRTARDIAWGRSGRRAPAAGRPAAAARGRARGRKPCPRFAPSQPMDCGELLDVGRLESGSPSSGTSAGSA